MVINTDDFKGRTITEIIAELYAKKNVIDYIRGKNLRGGDWTEAVANQILKDDRFDTAEIDGLCR